MSNNKILIERWAKLANIINEQNEDQNPKVVLFTAEQGSGAITPDNLKNLQRANIDVTEIIGNEPEKDCEYFVKNQKPSSQGGGFAWETIAYFQNLVISGKTNNNLILVMPPVSGITTKYTALDGNHRLAAYKFGFAGFHFYKNEKGELEIYNGGKPGSAFKKNMFQKLLVNIIDLNDIVLSKEPSSSFSGRAETLMWEGKPVEYTGDLDAGESKITVDEYFNTIELDLNCANIYSIKNESKKYINKEKIINEIRHILKKY